MVTAYEFNQRAAAMLPGHLGIVITLVGGGECHAEMPVRHELMAPNGFLHAGSIVSLADSCAGAGCMAHLPEGANGFTTIELKSNHLATVRDGVVLCTARLVHGGRTTQVWDATVTHRDSGKILALFRCTQMVLYPRGPA